MDKSNDSHLAQKAREARIRELEQELALLKANSSLHPAHSAGTPIDPDTWLIDTIKHLLSEHNSAGIDYALKQLADFLELGCVGVWRFDMHHQHLELVAHRMEEPQPAWISCLIQDKHHSLKELQNGSVVQFMASQPPSTDATRVLMSALCQSTYTHVALVPIQRTHSTVGVIALRRQGIDAWRKQDLDVAAVVGDMLTSVDERQRLLNKLAERDTRFQYAMEASRDGLWDWDITTGKVYFSSSYLRMLGYEYDGLPGHIDTLRNHFLLPEDCEQVMTQYQAALDNQRTHMNLEFRMRHKNGEELWIYSRAKFVEPDSEGRAQRCVGINANITDFINSQEELLLAKTQADLANSTKSEFLARMSHEIRTPMNAIVGLGHLLQDSALNDQQRSYINSMNAASESLLHIINQVLDFSKIESGKIILENIHFDIEQVLEKLSRLFEVSAIHRKVDIVYDIAPGVPRFLRGDALRLNQVLSNLVGNALLYSERDNVVVRIKKKIEDVHTVTLEFDIIDSGVGISPEQLQHLQNNLYRLKTDNQPGNNAGFGLSICHHLVTLMGGEITIDSTPGQGSNIRFTATFEHSHIGATTLRDERRNLAQLRTLVVDDNAIARDIIASTARLIHLRVDTAEGGSAALERIRAAETNGAPYQVVLMDYKIPGINGLEATTLIKSDGQLQHTPLVILVTSYRRDEILLDQRSAELVDGFLTKPVSESRLFDAISSLFVDQVASPGKEDDQACLLNGSRVLVAEDNLVNQQVVHGILKKYGVQVTFASNGREAVALFNADSLGFDIILMDIEMPEMSGFEATAVIRQGKHFPHTPIVAVTAQAMRGDREQCIKAGMDGYISKPIRPALLYSSLEDILRSKSLTNGK